MRAMDEHGKWLPKSRKVYDLDENGERIKLPSGRWKSHKEDEDTLQLPEDDGDEDEEVDVNEDYEAESDDEPV